MGVERKTVVGLAMIAALAMAPARAADSPAVDALVKIASYMAGKYADCAKRYAMRYANTTASPGDVAMGAIGGCGVDRDNYRKVFTTPNQAGITWTSEEVLIKVRDLDEDVKAIVVHSILQARYPTAR